jgi:hypothetical protein
MSNKGLIGLITALLMVGTAGTASANLVTNGDFSAGNTGFTSAYAYSNPMYWQPTHYTVGNYVETPHASFYDHTAGTPAGAMMIVDGAYSASATVWQENIIVTPDSDYEFKAWARSTYDGPLVMLGFLINNVQVGTLTLAGTSTKDWQEFRCIWNSGSVTGATLRIVDLQTNNSVPGNDFALDDISFSGSAVPLPAAGWLFGSGLLGLAGLRKTAKR